MDQQKRPNILFIMSDDHALQAITAYRPEHQVPTPGIDRLAENGMRFNNCLCTNSICSPSRASILTGTYNHLNGVRNLELGLDSRINNVAKVLQSNDYQTAIIGKWHLGTKPENMPSGFDHYQVFRGQGEYYDPFFYTDKGDIKETGYSTELITKKVVEWLDQRDPDRPFFMMCHHKAPHRNWQPSPKYKDAYKHIQFRHPDNYNDDYATRGPNAEYAKMKVVELTDFDTKGPAPEGLSEQELKDWKFQRYMEDYTATIASVDDSVDELLDYLGEHDLMDDTIVIYTSDQGFYIGEHGWFDKRFMYEESHHMPFLIQYPRAIPAGTVTDEMVLNIDFAALFLDYAGIDQAELNAQGASFRHIVEADEDAKGYEHVYYRYYDYPNEHNVYPHYGVRGRRWKLILFENPENKRNIGTYYWELYDLENDPSEMNNIYGQEGTEDVVEHLKREMTRLREKYEEHDPDWQEVNHL